MFHVEHFLLVEMFKNMKIKYFIIFFLFFAIGCIGKRHQPSESEKALQKITNYFIGKTPNELYNDFGKPNKYEIQYNSNKQIVSSTISYNYVYNFNDKTYECVLSFITDKNQEYIVNTNYSSDKCLSITSY